MRGSSPLALGSLAGAGILSVSLPFIAEFSEVPLYKALFVIMAVFLFFMLLLPSVSFPSERHLNFSSSIPIRGGWVWITDLRHSYKTKHWKSEDIYDILQALNSNQMIAYIISYHELLFAVSWMSGFLCAVFSDVLSEVLPFLHRRELDIGMKCFDEFGDDFFIAFLGPSLAMYTPLHLNQLGSSESSYDHRYLYIADKQLDLRHHDMVLEIGCNWGSFSSFMVKRYSCSVLALTSSDCQAKYAKNQVSVNDLQELISVQAIESLSSFYIPPCDSMDYELLPHEQSSQYAKFSKIVCTDFTLTFLGYPNFSGFVKNLSHYCFSSAHTEPEQFSHSISTGTLMVLEVTTTNYSNRRGSSASPASSPYARTRPSSPPNQTKHFLSTDFLEPFFYYEHFSSVFPTLDISLPMLATLEYYIKTLASHKFIVRSVNNITKDYSRGYYEWYMNFRKNRDWVERVYGESVYKNWELWLAWTASITERSKVERWSIVAEYNG